MAGEVKCAKCRCVQNTSLEIKIETRNQVKTLEQRQFLVFSSCKCVISPLFRACSKSAGEHFIAATAGVL